MKDSPKVLLGLAVEPELKKRIRIRAAEEGVLMSALVRRVLEEYLEAVESNS